MTLDDQRLILRGRKLPHVGSRPSESHPAGRVCAAAGCQTRLSIYNPSAWCWLHKGPTWYGHRGEHRATTD